MVLHDSDTTGAYRWHMCFGYDGHPIFTFSSVFSEKTDAAIYPVSGESSACRNIWNVSGLLFEKRQHCERKPWPARVHRDSRCCGAAPLETANAFVHRRRYDLLHVNRTIPFLRKERTRKR